MKIKFLKLLAGAAAIFFAAQFTNAQTVGMTNSSGVTTQTVSTAGNNSVNGSPGAFGITGVGATTPANSTAVNTTSTNNVVINTNSTIATTSSVVTAGSISSSNQHHGMRSGIRERIRDLLANKSRRGNGNAGNNNLTARLINAGSISSGNGNVSVNDASNNFEQNDSNQNDRVAFDLTFFEQSTNRGENAIVAKNSVTDRDIIAALAGATGNDFSSRAKLIVGSSDNSSNGVETIEVQDGSNMVDVSSFFMVSNSDMQVSGKTSNGNFQNGNGIRGLQNGLRAGQGATTFSILYVTFDANGVTNSVNDTNSVATGLSFSVNGFNVTAGATNSEAVDADVSGTGTDTNGAPAVIKGTITVSGKNNSSP